MPLTIKRFEGGPAATNAYLVADSSTGDAIVIDGPADVSQAILETAESLGVTVLDIIVTHGHWDHILGLNDLRSATNATIHGHRDLRGRIESPAPGTGPLPIAPVSLDHELDEGDEVTVGGHVFTVMYMPGHDIAHIVLYSEDDGLVLGGDVLFPGGHGRTDLPGSDQQTMNRTLRRFLDMPDDVRVLPGHGEATTIGAERVWITSLPQH